VVNLERKNLDLEFFLGGRKEDFQTSEKFSPSQSKNKAVQIAKIKALKKIKKKLKHFKNAKIKIKNAKLLHGSDKTQSCKIVTYSRELCKFTVYTGVVEIMYSLLISYTYATLS